MSPTEVALWRSYLRGIQESRIEAGEQLRGLGGSPGEWGHGVAHRVSSRADENELRVWSMGRDTEQSEGLREQRRDRSPLCLKGFI